MSEWQLAILEARRDRKIAEALAEFDRCVEALAEPVAS